MTPEEKGLLERTAKITEENYRILRGLQSSARWGRFWGLIKWAVILVPLVLGYFYIQPYLGQIIGLYSQVLEQSNQIKNIQGQLPNFGDLLKQVQGVLPQ